VSQFVLQKLTVKTQIYVTLKSQNFPEGEGINFFIRFFEIPANIPGGFYHYSKVAWHTEMFGEKREEIFRV